jgi:hypothetical protein
MSKPSELINIDTFGQTYSTNNQYQTYSLSTASIATAPNSYNINVPLNFTRSNVKRIALKSLEMPIGFPSIRASSNLHILTIASDSAYATSYSIVLSDKNYSLIATLIADINAAFTGTYPTYGITVQLASNGNVQIVSTNSSIFPSNIYVKPNFLAYLLGFRAGLNTLTTRNIIAAAAYRLSLDDYVNLYLPQFSSNLLNTNGTNCSFKIPINATNGVVHYRTDPNPAYVGVSPGFHFNSISLCIYDKFGYSLSSYGQDISLTLELFY